MSDDDEDMGGADEGDTTSDDQGDGPIERFPSTELKPLLRLEVDGSLEMTKMPYARGPNKCPIFPMRQFRERRHFKHHIGKVHNNDESAGSPLQGCYSWSLLSLTGTSYCLVQAP